MSTETATVFNQEYFFNLLDEVEALMLSGLPPENDLINRIINESAKNTLLRDVYATLYEKIESAGADREGTEIMINFFNTTRSQYDKEPTSIQKLRESY